MTAKTDRYDCIRGGLLGVKNGATAGIPPQLYRDIQ